MEPEPAHTPRAGPAQMRHARYHRYSWHVPAALLGDLHSVALGRTCLVSPELAKQPLIGVQAPIRTRQFVKPRFIAKALHREPKVPQPAGVAKPTDDAAEPDNQ